jgi:hypothetical protein
MVTTYLAYKGANMTDSQGILRWCRETSLGDLRVGELFEGKRIRSDGVISGEAASTRNNSYPTMCSQRLKPPRKKIEFDKLTGKKLAHWWNATA